jgi:hypothetical protein
MTKIENRSFHPFVVVDAIRKRGGIDRENQTLYTANLVISREKVVIPYEMTFLIEIDDVVFTCNSHENKD